MTSINALPPSGPPTLPVSVKGVSSDTETRPARPDLKAIKFEKGTSADKAAPPEKPNGPLPSSTPHTTDPADTKESAGTENAPTPREAQKPQIKEQYLALDHDSETLMWKEFDPASGEKNSFPSNAAARAYGKVQAQAAQEVQGTGSKTEEVSAPGHESVKV